MVSVLAIVGYLLRVLYYFFLPFLDPFQFIDFNLDIFKLMVSGAEEINKQTFI
jgi:hypothetical protein